MTNPSQHSKSASVLKIQHVMTENMILTSALQNTDVTTQLYQYQYIHIAIYACNITVTLQSISTGISHCMTSCTERLMRENLVQPSETIPYSRFMMLWITEYVQSPMGYYIALASQILQDYPGAGWKGGLWQPCLVRAWGTTYQWQGWY